MAGLLVVQRQVKRLQAAAAQYVVRTVAEECGHQFCKPVPDFDIEMSPSIVDDLMQCIGIFDVSSIPVIRAEMSRKVGTR